MDEEIVIVLPGKPAAWQRARSHGKIRFDSPEQALNKMTIGQIGAAAMKGRPPLDGPIEVMVAAYWPWPKSMSEKKRRVYGAQYYTGRPDGDNVMKLLGDALNNIVWRDDSLIVTHTVSKRYSLRPETVIRIRTLVGDP
jgi:Holliday junction resolvase RusA-like endonuclease